MPNIPDNIAIRTISIDKSSPDISDFIFIISYILQ